MSLSSLLQYTNKLHKLFNMFELFVYNYVDNCDKKSCVYNLNVDKHLDNNQD